MIKNVTIRDSARQVLGHAESLPTKESEQREYLRRKFGPGKYLLTYNGPRVTADGQKYNGGINKAIYVGDALGQNEIVGARAGNMSQSAIMPTGQIDISLYRELLGPMIVQIRDTLAAIQEKQIELADNVSVIMSDFLDDETGDPATDETAPQDSDKSARMLQAMERLKNGEPIDKLMIEYADIVPDIMGMLPQIMKGVNL